MQKWGKRSSRFSSMRKSGRGSFVEVLIPCFLIKSRSSSTVVRSNEESWCWLEVDDEGSKRMSLNRFVDEGKLERILETLVRK